VLGHLIEYLLALAPAEFIFITGPGGHGEQVRAFVQTAYPRLPARFLVQEEPRGQAHAVALAEPYVRGPLLIAFVDTLFEADLAALRQPPGDGALVTHHVDDPSRFGVVVTENGRVTRLVEKPAEPLSHDAIIGVYALKRPEPLFRAIRALLGSDAARGGEYFLADAVQRMVDEGAHLTTVPAAVWQDTGTIEAILGTEGPPFQALNYLLEKHGRVEGAQDHSVIIPPVHLPASATVIESVVGPYVSVDEGAVIRRSVVRQSIIGKGTLIDGLHLAGSLIGDEATATGRPAALNISDHSSVSS